VAIVVECVRSGITRSVADAVVVLFRDITTNLLQPWYNDMDTEYDRAKLTVGSRSPWDSI
jgi:hypothetical protein